MGTFLFIAIVSTILIACLLPVSRISRDRPQDHVSFRVAVRRPDLWWRMVIETHRRRLAAGSVTLADAGMRRCVLDLLRPGKQEDAKMRLAAQGPRAVPFLLDALDDPRYRRPRRGKGIFSIVHSTALEHVLRLLEPYAPPQAIPRLAPLVEDPDEEVRKQAGGFLAMLGLPECIGPVSKALGDSHDFVRGRILMKIRKAIAEKRASREFLEGIFDSVVPLLDREDASVSGDAPRCLLAISPERASVLFLSPERFHPNNRRLYLILDAANELAVPLSAGKLMDLLFALRPDAGDYPKDYAYGRALIALAVAQHDEAAPLARDALTWGNSRVKEDAVQALAVLAGIPRHHDHAFRRWYEAGNEVLALPAPLRDYLLVRFFIDELNNGGWSQFFFNTSGDRARETVAALREVGATRDSRLLMAAMALFGMDGPSPGREKRMRQLSAIADRLDMFQKAPYVIGADREAGGCTHTGPEKPRTEVLLVLHAIRHREHFGPSWWSCAFASPPRRPPSGEPRCPHTGRGSSR